MFFGNFGEGFPYTNFHDLNLDWIIKTMRELANQFPSMLSEIETKLNKPTAPGGVGQVLVNIGNGNTKWEDISEEYIPTIIEAVNDWLDEHPEATTTVQDKSLTLAKMTDETRYEIIRKESGTIAPIYVGDYLKPNTILPSSCVLHDGKFYCVNAPENNHALEQHSGYGTVSVFDVATNSKIEEYSVLVGHGNSIAFDGTYFYIAPIWEYGEGRVDTNKVYKYTETFILTQELIAPSRIMGLSFDSHANTLYALDYNGKIYKYANNTFTEYTTISNWSNLYSSDNIVMNTYYNQDIAINNDEFYISSPTGNILHGYLKETSCVVTDYIQTLRTDSTTRYIFGELEGMEFTDDHLYAITYVLLPNDVKDAFVVELPVNHINATSPVMMGDFTVRDATLTLSEATQSKFFLNTYEIRSILQLFARTLNANSSQVEIPASNLVIDDYDIFIPSQNIALTLKGSYTCKTITVSGGELVICPASADNLLTFTTTQDCITLRRAGNLRISGDNALNVSTPNVNTNDVNFIIVGNDQPTTIIRPEINSVEHKTPLIGSYPIQPYETYFSSTPILFLPKTFSVGSAIGYISGSSADLHILIRTPKGIRNANCQMTGTITVRGTLGYLDNAYQGIDVADLTKQYYKLDDYTLEVVLRKSGGTAFDNCENNTPVVITGTMTFNW